jgi:hypothetical protein
MLEQTNPSPNLDVPATNGEDVSVSQQADEAQDTQHVRTPTALIQRHGKRLVNGMMNFGFLSGFAFPNPDGPKNSILLQQNNNLEHALRLDVKSQSINVQRLYGRPVTVLIHVRGIRNEHGPQCMAQVIEIDRPSILDLPTMSVWMAGMGAGKSVPEVVKQMARDGFSPFDADGQIKDEFKPYITRADAASGNFEMDPAVNEYVKAMRMLREVMDASGSVVDSRLGAGQNYVSIAGFVDSKALVPATEHRQEYGLIMLRQQRNPDENIPVRLRGSKMRVFLDRVKEGQPILVEGVLRRKVIPDDNGQIVSSHTYVETRALRGAQFGTDITATPDWWMEIRERLLQKTAARKTAAINKVQQSSDDAKSLSDSL